MDLIATRSMTYATRRLLPGDSFIAPDRVGRVLIASKKAALAASGIIRPVATGDRLPELRSEYQQTTGKKPFHGWNATTLQEKIAAAKG